MGVAQRYGLNTQVKKQCHMTWNVQFLGVRIELKLARRHLAESKMAAYDNCIVHVLADAKQLPSMAVSRCTMRLVRHAVVAQADECWKQ